MKSIGWLLLTVYLMVSCSKDGFDSDGYPDGKFRVLERQCFCWQLPADWSMNYTFNRDGNTLLVETLDEKGMVENVSSRTYGVKGDNITIDGREHTFKKNKDNLEITYLDDPRIADDELTLILKKS